jgi:hypothetical protein
MSLNDFEKNYIQQGAWDDSQSPAFAFGVGGSSPSLVAFPSGSDLRLYRCDGSDIFYWSLQFPHTILPSGVILRPHVHWSMVANPTAGQTLTWKIDYIFANPLGTFQSGQQELVAPAYTTVGDEALVHKITNIGDIKLQARPSLIVLGRLLASAVPASQNPVVLGFDIHFQKGPYGTETEFV